MKSFISVILVSFMVALSQPSLAKIVVVDVTGRTVEIEQPAKNVILGEGRFISIFSVLGIEQPISKIAGMMNEFELYDPDTYAAYRKVYPEIEQIPYFGRTSAESVSVEQILLLNPDLAIFGLAGHGPSAESKHIVDKLEAANIPVVFIDFRQHPIENTAKSVEIVGRLLGVPERAQAFAQLYQQGLKRISTRVASIPLEAYPSVLIDLKANSNEVCCFSVAEGLFAEMARFAGGRSIANGLLKGPVGQLSYEHVLSANFDVYMGTGIGSKHAGADANSLLLTGAGVSDAHAQESLRRFLNARQFNELPAVKNNRAYSLWHHFYNSPLNLFAIESMAKWFHPELFADVDPKQTLNDMLSGAQPVNFLGAYSASIEAQE